MEKLKIIGAPDSHETLINTLKLVDSCKILDAPAGTGVLAKRLKEMGHDVHCADIDPGNFRLEGVPFTKVNLNERIDLPRESFDTVVCANGVHRLFNLGSCLREFARVLRANGSLFINFNNYASIEKRLRFLFYGSIDNAINDPHCNQTVDSPQANIRIALLVPHLVNELRSAGFEVQSIRSAAVRKSDLILAPFGWMFRFLSLLVPTSSYRRNHLSWANCSGVFPGGRYMLIEARKTK